MVLLIGDCSLNIGKCHKSYRFNKYIHIVFKQCYRDFKDFQGICKAQGVTWQVTWRNFFHLATCPTFSIFQFPIMHSVFPPNFALTIVAECSWEYADLPRVFHNNSLCKKECIMENWKIVNGTINVMSYHWFSTRILKIWEENAVFLF